MSGQWARTQAKPSSRALVEGRRDDVDVGQMAPAEVGIVVDEHVAGRERSATRWITAFTASGIEPR